MKLDLTRLRSYLEEAAALDARALALGRMGLALLLLYDLAIRSGDIAAHYSDEGVEPRSEVGLPLLPLFRLYFVSGSSQWVVCLFCLAAIAAGALLVGHRTRLATAVSWSMLVSLQMRNGAVLQGGDDLLVMFLMWGMFLPLGRCWALDARRLPKPAPLLYSGTATFAFYGQLFMLYFIAGTLKMNSPHWRWGNGIYDALSADYFVTAFGQRLYQHDYLLKVLSWATLLLESCGPLLLFVPPRRWKLRMGLVLAFLCFHIGISASMRIGMFSFVCMAGWLFLIPSGFFARLTLRPCTRQCEPAPRARFAQACAAVVFIYLVIAAIVADRWPQGLTREVLLKPARLFALQEHWGMFVKPRADSGFLVANAVLDNGQRVDLLRAGSPLSWQQPALVIDLFSNQRWRKMLMGFTSNANQKRAERYLGWLCQRDKMQHVDRRVVNIELTYVSHTVGPRYQHGAEQRKVLAQRRCSL